MIYSHVAIGWFSCGESSTNKPTRGKRTSMGGTDLKITQGHPMSHLIYTLEHVWMKWFGVSASWTENTYLILHQGQALVSARLTFIEFMMDLHRCHHSEAPDRTAGLHHAIMYIYIYLNTCMYTHVIILYLHMIAYIYNININKYVN